MSYCCEHAVARRSQVPVESGSEHTVLVPEVTTKRLSLAVRHWGSMVV